METPRNPGVKGLAFRGIKVPEDYSDMWAIMMASSADDGYDYTETVEDIERYYSHLAHCDVSKDVLFAEVDGKAVGYSRVWYLVKNDKPGFIFQFFAHLMPEWRGKGIRESMLEWCERRILDICVELPETASNDVLVWVMDKERDWKQVLEDAGYKVVRYGFTMLRPDLDNIPDCPLPEGIEVRPVEPEHYRKIWEADQIAANDSGLSIKPEDEWYQGWLSNRLFQPEIWQVAWDGDRVAGAVQNYIDHEENARFNRKRGWTENIHVGREWRGRGVAKALIARSFGVLRDRGMTEAALGVDAMNPTGALHLYKRMGFVEYRKSLTYSKPVNDIRHQSRNRR